MSTFSEPAADVSRLPSWMDALEREVLTHRAVRHPLFERLARDRSALSVFGLQHVALVGCFTTYMEWLLLRAPSSMEKLWLAKVLVNEYGEGTDGDDHEVLYRRFLTSLGVAADAIDCQPLDDTVWDFVEGHLRTCRSEPYLVGLGALGPGHEWAIPDMFSRIVPALEAHGVAAADALYFTAHQEQDVDHGAWMSEALRRLVTTPADAALVRRGALWSLDLRAALWDAVLARLDHGPAPGAEAQDRDVRALRAKVHASRG